MYYQDNNTGQVVYWGNKDNCFLFWLHAAGVLLKAEKKQREYTLVF